MKTFADVKRRLVVGAKLKLVRHDWVIPNSPLKIGLVREIQTRQENAMLF